MRRGMPGVSVGNRARRVVIPGSGKRRPEPPRDGVTPLPRGSGWCTLSLLALIIVGCTSECARLPDDFSKLRDGAPGGIDTGCTIGCHSESRLDSEPNPTERG